MAVKAHQNVVRMIGMCQELNNFSIVRQDYRVPPSARY
jgi:hypothetical protein